MHIVSVRDLLEMTGEPLSHQELKAEGKLQQWREGMVVVFISHQWLGAKHPDQHGCQLAILQIALRNIIDGTIVVEGDSAAQVNGLSSKLTEAQRRSIAEGFVFLDWFSVPQVTSRMAGVNDTGASGDAYAAINSIPAYVESCEFFMVLAPPLVHNDTGRVCDRLAWLTRGWCRGEFWCRVLSNRATEIICIESGTGVQFMLPLFWQQSPPSDGIFTVESDRTAVVEIVVRAFDSKLATLTADGRIELYRYFAAMRPRLLGLSLSARDDNTFLRDFRFRSPTDHGIKGLGPVACAALAEDTAVLARLVQQRAQVDMRMEKIPELFIAAGATPLILTAQKNPRRVVLQTLITARADVGAQTDLGFNALHVCFYNADAVLTLLDGGVPLEQLASIGQTPLNCAAGFCEPSVAECLLNRRAAVDPPPVGLGVSPLMSVAQFSGNLDTANVLLKHRADPNFQATPTGIPRVAFGACRLANWMGANSLVIKQFAELSGNTPLGVAAMSGKTQLTKLLLEARADPKIQNMRGHDAADLAHEFADVLDLLASGISAGEPPLP